MHQRKRRLEVGIGQVGKHRLDLLGRQHPLVDERVAGEADEVTALFHVIGNGQRIHNALEPFPDDIQLALEPHPRVAPRQAAIAADEYLRDERFDRDRARPNVPVVRRYVAPAEQLLTLLGDDLFEHALDRVAPIRLAWQEHEPDAVLAFGRQGKRRHFAKEAIGDLHQDARPVAGVGFAAARAAVPQVHQHLQRLLHDRVRTHPLDVRDEADATGVVLVPGIVEASRALLRDRGHVLRVIAVPDSEEKYNDYIYRMTKRNGCEMVVTGA